MNHTILNNLHIDLGARMGEFGGWNMPIQYEGIIKEHHHTRTSCSIFDICHMGEIEIVGENAERDLNNLLTANISSMSINQVKYSFLLNENGAGRMIAPVIGGNFKGPKGQTVKFDLF